MSRAFATLACVLFAGVALAGCTGGDTTTTTTPPTTTTTTTTTTPPVTTTPETNDTLGEDAYTLEAVGLPKVIITGTEFTFKLYVNGTPERSTNHVAAHFGAASSDAPSLQVYDNACPHMPGELPGEFDVTCKIEEAGTWYLRGHARLNESGTILDFWTAEHMVKARAPVGNYTLTTTLSKDVPHTVVKGTNLTFNLTLSGPDDVSDHIGGHFGGNRTAVDQASTTAYPHSCAHVEGDLPGTYQIKCKFDEAGTWYLRGHMRITVGAMKHDFWTADEYQVIVPATPL